MLLEIAVGDAYGVGFEMADKEFCLAHNHLSYIPGNIRVLPGSYSDDTQMSLAITEMMLSDLEWAPVNIANKFLECFHRDRRHGYAGHFYNFLTETQTGEDFLKNIKPDSERCGAAMRAAPLGLIKDIEELTLKCDMQSALTHNTIRGKGAALCVALSVNAFVHQNVKKSELIKYLNNYFKFDLNKIKSYEFISTDGWQCVLAALYAIINSDNLADILKTCIDFSGDTDSIAAIAMGISSVCSEIEKNIPSNLLEGLENGQYGKDYIIKLDEKLCQSMKI